MVTLNQSLSDFIYDHMANMLPVLNELSYQNAYTCGLFYIVGERDGITPHNQEELINLQLQGRSDGWNNSTGTNAL